MHDHLPAQPSAPLAEWQGLLEAVTAGARRVVVQDESGRRFVLTSEADYERLERTSRTGRSRAQVVLTTREREVLAMIADGVPGAVTAERLGLATNTVAST